MSFESLSMHKLTVRSMMINTPPLRSKHQQLAIWFAWFLLLLASFSVQAVAECEPRACQQSSAGEFEMGMPDGSQRRALLLNTQVLGDISGMVASINVMQSFKNDTDQWISGRYVFPLPQGAAIDSLKIQIGDRLINGIVQEKKQAHKTFQDAKKAGKKAGLLKQHRPNLFSVSVASIAPHETIAVHIHYIDSVQYQNQAFSMRFPTTLTPRYIPGSPLAIELAPSAHQAPSVYQKTSAYMDTNAHADRGNFIGDNTTSEVAINPETGWGTNTDQVIDAADITPPQTQLQPSQALNLFNFKLSIEAGLALSSVTSSSHAITKNFSTTTNGKDLVEVSLANSVEPMDTDLVLQWQANIGSAPQAALFKQSHTPSATPTETNYYSMLMVTPPAAGVSQNLPRDITFIIDSSGSMAGTSMQQAKQSLLQGLQYLSTYDKFNVVDFDSQYRPLFNQSLAASVHNLERAESMINQLSADGGTEILDALDFALSQAVDESYLRQIIFITDGSIGNETELFELINRKLGNARLFTIGIGSAPNTHFMSKAAKFGRGSFTYVSDLNQVNALIQALFDKINQPRLRNIKIDWPIAVEQYPERVPDLYAGEPILVIAKSNQAIDIVAVSGQLLDRQWQQTVSNLSSGIAKIQSKNLNTLWARHKIQTLTEELHSPASNQVAIDKIKDDITELGIAHQLITKFTSFVAVEQIISRPQGATDKHHNVANLMPKGSSMAAPSTATAGDLYLILGSFLLLFAWFVLIAQTKTSKKYQQTIRGLLRAY
jgi:Ca-activated chloride channel family protein